MIDIDMKTKAGKFKFRVAGILIDDKNRVLIQKIGHNNFYCLPGGHVEFGETSTKAVERELKEELQFDVNIERLQFIIENIFTGTNNLIVHELGMYYILKSTSAPTSNWQIVENDKGVEKTLTHKWIPLNKLNSIDFRPSFLKEKLQILNNETLEHITIVNNTVQY